MDICKFLHEYVLFNMSGSQCFCERSFFFYLFFVQLYVLVDIYVLQIQGVPIKNWLYGICLLKGNGNLPFHIKYPVLNM